MAEIFSGTRIYIDGTETVHTERLVPTSLLWDDVERLYSHKNVGTHFENRCHKTAFKLRNGDILWFCIPYSKALKLWKQYHGDEEEVVTLPPINPN